MKKKFPEGDPQYNPSTMLLVIVISISAVAIGLNNLKWFYQDFIITTEEIQEQLNN